MRCLTPDERLILSRAVAGETWFGGEDEMLVIAGLHRRGLLGRVLIRDEKGVAWFRFPPVPSSALALRVDAAYRQTVDQ
jgi:hypothetical protein